MPKTTIYSLVLIFALTNLTAQTAQNFRLSGQIKDIETQEPVPYATIVVLNKLAAVADDQGNFSLFAENARLETNDSLIIQSLGYQSKKMPIGNLAQGAEEQSFFLKPIAYPIKEVAVFPDDKQMEKVWLQPPFDPKECNTYSPYSIHDGNKNRNPFGEKSQHAIRFIPKTEGQLMKVKYYISRKGKQKTPFQLRIYERNPKTKLPGNDLLQESILAKAKRGNEWVVVDLSQQQIKINKNGFFVAIEAVYDGDKGFYTKKYNGKKELYYGFVSKSCYVEEGIYCTEAEKETDFSTVYCLDPKKLQWGKCSCSPKDSSWYSGFTSIPLIGAEVRYD